MATDSAGLEAMEEGDGEMDRVALLTPTPPPAIGAMEVSPPQLLSASSTCHEPPRSYSVMSVSNTTVISTGSDEHPPSLDAMEEGEMDDGIARLGVRASDSRRSSDSTGRAPSLEPVSSCGLTPAMAALTTASEARNKRVSRPSARLRETSEVIVGPSNFKKRARVEPAEKTLATQRREKSASIGREKKPVEMVNEGVTEMSDGTLARMENIVSREMSVEREKEPVVEKSVFEGVSQTPATRSRREKTATLTLDRKPVEKNLEGVTKTPVSSQPKRTVKRERKPVEKKDKSVDSMSMKNDEEDMSVDNEEFDDDLKFSLTDEEKELPAERIVLSDVDEEKADKVEGGASAKKRKKKMSKTKRAAMYSPYANDEPASVRSEYPGHRHLPKPTHNWSEALLAEWQAEASLDSRVENDAQALCQWLGRDEHEATEAAQTWARVQAKAREKELCVASGTDKVEWVMLYGQARRWRVKAWYRSAYPLQYARLDTLHLCHTCFHFAATERILMNHKSRCVWRDRPPGWEIYRDDKLSVFEVNAARNYEHESFCANLGLFAMLFIKDKAVFCDVQPFVFYVVVSHSDDGFEIVGYFSKQRLFSTGQNLCCICVFPQYQGKGYGSFIIDLSYLLSRMEGVPGSPERPLSPFGFRSYKMYWGAAIHRALTELGFPKKTKDGKMTVKIEDVQALTGMLPSDIVETIVDLELARKPKKKDEKVMTMCVHVPDMEWGEPRAPLVHEKNVTPGFKSELLARLAEEKLELAKEEEQKEGEGKKKQTSRTRRSR